MILKALRLNGTDNNAARHNAEHLSQLGGNCRVRWIHNRTHFLIFDLIECAVGYMGFTTQPVRQLHHVWTEEITRRGTVLRYCHSQGAIHTRIALALLSPEMRERIMVVAIAPAMYASKKFCRQVWHYRNENTARDFVPQCDRLGAYHCQDTIRDVRSHPDAPSWFDHSFTSPTYKSHIQEHMLTFTTSNGQRI